MKRILFVSCLALWLPALVSAQFSSGSTGADGVLDLSTMSCPSNTCEIQLPESGVLNYTTVNIPNGKVLRFKSNSRNTPVIMLAQGNITIEGTINVSAGRDPLIGRTIPGPGGFYGSAHPNEPGGGPGGGTSTSCNGKWVGPLTLSPIVGGSGGCNLYCCGPSLAGGSGGGAIVIASSTTFYMGSNSLIFAEGNSGDFNSFGSGGAVRLIANQLNAAGLFRACLGSCGVVKLEALQGQLNFSGNSQPPATLVPFTLGNVPTVSTNSLPKLTIQSIGGYVVPSYAGSRFDTVDLLLPNQIPDPVNVVVNANNIPVGSEVRVGFISGSGSSTPCSLAGTFASSSCTATISNLIRTGVTYLLATAVFTPPASLARFNPKGANQVAKIRLEAILGTKPKYVFLSSRDKVIDSAKISKEFLQYFGM